jgi:hypothetical protein
MITSQRPPISYISSTVLILIFFLSFFFPVFSEYNSYSFIISEDFWRFISYKYTVISLCGLDGGNPVKEKYTFVYIYPFMYIYIYVYIYIYIYMYVHLYTYIYIHIHICLCIYTYIYIYIYTRICLFKCCIH